MSIKSAVHHIAVLLVALASVPHRASGADEASDATGVLSQPVEVEWFDPKITETKKFGSMIELKGRTLPSASIRLSSDTIMVLTLKGKIRALPSGKVNRSDATITADDDGDFKIELLLPPGTAQIPITVTSNTGLKKDFQLAIRVREEEVAFATEPNPTEVLSDSRDRRRPSLWAALGYNYVTYDQTGASTDQVLAFQSLNGPSWFIEGQWEFNPRWRAVASYRSTPGQAASSDVFTVTGENYTWSMITAEAVWSPTKWTNRLLGFEGRASLRFGLQNHTMPFLVRLGDDRLAMRSNRITMASAGGIYELKLDSATRAEITMGYQHPIQTGDVATISSSFAFDGSIGVAKTYSESWQAGLFWLGQFHKHNFSQKSDASVTNPSGANTLLFSNFEFRLGYLF